MTTLKKIGKWTGIVMLTLVLLLVLAYGAIHVITEKRINKTYSVKVDELIIPSDSLSIQKGKQIYLTRNCADCHGKNLEGSTFMDKPLLLQLTSPNLTRGKGGLADDYATQDWVRALRHGINRQGRSLWIMPSHEITVLSREDLASLIAYCQSMPPVDSKEEKQRNMGPIARVLMLGDKVPVLPAEKIDHRTPLAEAAPLESRAYGRYLAKSCEGCHRADMKGGAPLAPGHPPVPDISASGAVGSWSEAEFIATLRMGQTPEGRQLRNKYMPWENMNHFTEEELKAIRTYLLSLSE